MGIFSEVGEIIAKEASAKNVTETPSATAKHYETKPEQQYDIFSEDLTPPPLEGEVISDGEDTLQVVVINRIVPSKNSSTPSNNQTPDVVKDDNDLSFWNMPPKIFEMPPEIKNAKIIPPVKTSEQIPQTQESVSHETPSVEEPNLEPNVQDPEPAKEEPVSTKKKEIQPPKRKASVQVDTSTAFIEGDIHFPKDAKVSADIHGNIIADGDLTFTGNIVGNVEAQNLILCGVIEGSLKCKSLTLLPINNSQMSCIKGSVSTEALYTEFSNEN